MAATSHLLASGPGWRVRDIVCTAGPGERVFEEQHAYCCIAAVTNGSFGYRSPQGTALLAPGALLLGNQGACFECSHDHAAGDRCLAFQFDPAYLEDILAGVPGVRRLAFSRAHLPPSPALAGLMAEMATRAFSSEVDTGSPATNAKRLPGENASSLRARAIERPKPVGNCSGGGAAAYEELAVRLAGAVAARLVDEPPATAAPSTRDARRVTRALRRIETRSQETLSLTELAREAAMSRYHFLRTFKTLIGMTPHQFLLRTRLHRSALLLRGSEHGVARIAFDCGFGDLSTFNRHFRLAMGKSPSAYRQDSRAA
ncbi:helix-turn-helix domain-containing protein [Bosea psychrotolerans]|uniref:AraC family transcriptional regulator n=1 Tax=Bosea psychrotolerans TaxID=1871628 RepID=A0A2S4LT93_9HYPH|nr:AraC family transcriptional regulator [Bosea psychrotolerans]POR45644.1 AraC family transcriptional regulator [Bosea psychrotolerans]